MCIGNIADEKNDKVYWFVFDTTTGGEKSYILQYDKTSVTPVFVDIDNTVLKFNTDKDYPKPLSVILKLIPNLGFSHLWILQPWFKKDENKTNLPFSGLTFWLISGKSKV